MKTLNVTLFIHRNLDFGLNDYEPEYRILPCDISKLDSSNVILLGTQDVELLIPDADFAEQAIAIIDDRINKIQDSADKKINLLKRQQAELRALPCL